MANRASIEKRLRRDILDFASLLYDIFKAKEVNASVEHDKNTITNKGMEVQS